MGHKGYQANMSKRTVRSQGIVRLVTMYRNGKGKSRHETKRTGEEKNLIHTSTTLHTYIGAWERFCRWLKGNGIHCSSLEDAKLHIQEYIDYLEMQPGCIPGTTMSAFTIWTLHSGICKACGCSSRGFRMPKRNRADIRRSRLPVASDARFSEEKHADFVSFCCSTGLRKNKELAVLRGTDLRVIDGKYYVHVRRGKGGRPRDAIICGSEAEVAEVVARMRQAGEDLVWPSIPGAADVHHYRAVYAQRVYDSVARDPAALPRKERYCCKADKRGIWYDRRALAYTSLQLGHNRVSVVANNYLY